LVTVGDLQYRAHVYGRRLHQISKRGASMHGIALDGEMALHESPLRVLEPGEGSAATEDACPVTGLDAAVTTHETAASGIPFAAEAFGRIWEFCGTGTEMLEQFEQLLIQRENAAQPNVFPPWISGELAAASAPSHTLGVQRVLVVRIDFSDVSGASVSAASAQATMDGNVTPFFESASYGRTTLVTTVSSRVYRMPRTAASYATSEEGWALFTDALAAAAADFSVNTFDRVIVAFPHIGPSRIANSRFGDAARATVGSSEIWINGPFAFHPVAHEVGHTYGLMHSNLWQVSDGNPVSSTGRSLEYGDPFDVMGQGVTPSADFNPPEKHRLAWLPDTAIRTVSTSGVYRVHRFDHRDALTFGQPLALRVFREGLRSYWIGLRQNAFANIPTVDGAYIVWDYGVGSTDLLDLTTPGTDARDAVLPLGAVLDDSSFGIRIKPIARGGTGSAQYLDLEITVPAAPPNGVWAWGSFNATRSIPPGMTNLSAFDANDSVVVAARADGSLVSWWTYGGGLASVPAGITNAATVSANGGVLKTDGTVEFWGPTVSGGTPPPPGLSGVRQLAMGYYHSLALKFDGTVVAWGLNEAGERAVPPDLKDVVAIAAGRQFSVAVKSDGTVVRWGRIYESDVPLPAGLRTAVTVAASHASQHFVVLKSDGTVLTAGASSEGQARVPAGLTNVVAIATGSSHSLALRSNGSVVAWGSGGANETVVPPTLPRAFALAASSQASFALTGTGAFVVAQPQSSTVAAGFTASLSVSVSALGPVSYQWRKNGAALAGATAATLILPNTSPGDSGFYDVVISTATNRVVSVPARVAIVPPLVIAQQPQAQTITEGGLATFFVNASGGGPLQYQWRKNGVVIPGATSRTLSIDRVAASDAASYDVLISDGVSTVTSVAARLTTMPSARIANLSIRSRAGGDAQALIVGFVVGGHATEGNKPLLLRGVGPGLLAFGVADALTDPRLELYGAAGRIAENDDWAGNPQIASIALGVGAFALAADSRDSALYQAAMAPGAYTAQVSAPGGPAGIAVAEIYDAESAETRGPSSRRLVNVSARTELDSSSALLFAGFNISGTGRKNVLIRGIGPTLAALGVAGALADPKLVLFNGSSTKLQENDDWDGSPALAAAFSAAGAFPLVAGSKDAALLATLEPGSYSVQVAGVGGAAGVALVEIYEIP
jgi:hypothetical protein